MIKIGMLIGERYEILEKIGTGGMSDVYKAKCHKLNRFVAVKVLKQEFSENANFVSKFRIEAQAAAGLMHPNIVNVYDVGEENGIYYIVMELVEGITLKKYIEKKARLSYKEAVSIGIQVSMGIEAAHNNHIIHRDIKPQNIIISKDGKVKVTDFGIAKAATSNTITSNVMGSVHYTSPEQARGGYSDEKSDIYSLGITLFEMLTGRVPFNGETTVAIAIRHIQEEMPSPKEFVPEIPASVAQIVLKCCQKSPDRRYQNVAELIKDLKQCLLNPDENFVVQNDPDTDGSTRMISDTEVSRIKRQSHQEYRDQDDASMEGQRNRRPAARRDFPEEETTMRLRSDTQSLYEDEDEDDFDYDPKMERVTTILAVVAGIIICGIIIFLAVKIFGGMGSKPGKEPSSPIVTDTEESTSSAPSSSVAVTMVEMPNVEGWSLEDAEKALKKVGLQAEIEYEESDVYEEDYVISTGVQAGAKVESGAKVKLTVSSGTGALEIPDTAGKTYAEAENMLTEAGFTVIKAESISPTVEKDKVISQNPVGGTKAPAGSTITVTVSIGPDSNKVQMPNLIGMSEEDGTITIVERGLVLKSVSYVYNSEVPEGAICYQNYSQGSYVDPGTPVEIKVSQGPETAAVTYKCNASIGAPTTAEAPDYVAGSSVNVKLVADDGTELLNTTTSSFPQAANYYGLKSSGGTVTFTYKVTTPGTTTTDPATGETVTTPGTTEDKSFTRRVEFVAE